jgi:Ubiquitin carboxyl-terminal hydrolase
MLFGGKLASFLVCEKCKHVSRTYEDFNDLSLSIKPEDFVKERKRKRLKFFAKKFGRRHTEEAQVDPPRSSSVPPSPSVQNFDPASDGPTVSPGPRRRRSHELAPSDSNDLVTVEVSEGNVVTDATAKSKEQLDASAHVEFVQPDKIKREFDKEEDNWLKLRRLSKSVGMKGIGRSKSRGRSSKTSKSSLDVGSAASVSIPTVAGGDTTDILPTLSPPSVEPAVVPNISSPGSHSLLPTAPSPSARLTPTEPNKIHKSPAPPPLSRQECAYLRHILSDTSSALSNPFAIFRPINPPLTNGAFTSPPNSGLWTKMSSLPNIEECLRWFTSVEILDGENMVGCRRCWKIANGMCKSVNADQSESDEDDEILVDSLSDVPSFVPNYSASPSDVGIDPTPQYSPNFFHSRSPASTSIISLPEESSLHRSERLYSALSLPTTIESSPPKSHALYPVPLDSGLLVSSTSSADLVPSTYVGIPIPSISTTAPEIPMSPQSTSRTVVPNPVYPSASMSLLAPKSSRRHQHRLNNDDDLDSPTDVSSDGFDETESEASPPDTSPFASSVVSPNASQEQLQILSPSGISKRVSPSKPSSKISRSTQIIMRRCYKRYLISEPPPVLVIHLKRFQQTSKSLLMSFSTGFKKLDDFVAFSEELDLTPFLAPNKEDFGLPRKKQNKTQHKNGVKARCMYRLYAVVVHIGNMVRYLCQRLICLP